MIEVPIPATFKVGGFDYTVRADEETNDALDTADLWGLHRTAKRQLLLDTTAPAPELSRLFLHECLHAVDSVFGGGTRLAERDISALAQGLFQIVEQLGIRFVLAERKAKKQ